jgi:hypothetical protein
MVSGDPLIRLNGWQRIGVVPLVVWFLAGGFSGVIARSQELPSQTPQVKTEKQSELSEEGTEFWPPLFGHRLKVTDTLLVTVTFLLFAATLALWWSTRRLVKSGENTAKRQLRAYIVATIKGCDVPETSDGIFTFHLAIKNTGQTPAHELKVISRTDIFDYPFTEDFDFSIPNMDNPSVSLLGAQEVTGSESRSEPMTSESWRHILNKNSGKRLCTYGTIRYHDIFEDPQHTNVCFVHSVEVRDPETGRVRVTSHVATRHNDAS